MANPILSLATSLSSPVVGNPNASSPVYVMGDLADEFGGVIVAHCYGYAHTLPTTTGVFQKGCLCIETDNASQWVNVSALTSAASWVNRF